MLCAHRRKVLGRILVWCVLRVAVRTVGCKYRNDHRVHVPEAAFAKHRRAGNELADRTSQVPRFTAHKIREQEPHNSAVLGVTLGYRPDLLKVRLQRRQHCNISKKEHMSTRNMWSLRSLAT